MNNDSFDQETHSNQKLSKVYEISQALEKKFLTFYNLRKNVTINKSPMLYKSRLAWIQLIPIKCSHFGKK